MQLSIYPDQWNDSIPVELFAGDLFKYYIKLGEKRNQKVCLEIIFPAQIVFKKVCLMVDGREKEISAKMSETKAGQEQLVTASIEAEVGSVIEITAVATKYHFWGNKSTELVKIQCKEKYSDSPRSEIKAIPVLITPVKMQLYWQSIVDIFGYSLIGVISYCFGLVLNWFNIEKNVHSFSKIVSPGQSVLYSVGTTLPFSNILLLILLFQFVFICLFSHAYAKVYLLQNQRAYKDEVKLSIYMTIGKWIEIVAVVICGLAVFAIFALGMDPVCLYVVLINGLVFWISTIRYRCGRTMPEDERYLLICPAILMIGLNIFLGASIDMLLNEQFLSLIGVAVFACFFLSMFFAHDQKTICIIYYVFVCILLIVGVLSFFFKSTVLKISFFYVFLGSVVSIYMAIFESWYIPFRQLLGKDKPQEKTYVHLVDRLLFFFPIIIAALYPFQQFNVIYLVSSFGGSLAAIIFWNTVVYPSIGKTISRNKRWSIPIVRAILGIATLVFLMLDKILWWELPSKEAIDLAAPILATILSGFSLLFGGAKKLQDILSNIKMFIKPFRWVKSDLIFTHGKGYLEQFFIHQGMYLALVLVVFAFIKRLFLDDGSPISEKISSVNIIVTGYAALLLALEFVVKLCEPDIDSKVDEEAPK